MRDPMKPLYEQPAIEDKDEISSIIREVLRFIRQINPHVMQKWTMEDTNDAIQMAKQSGYTSAMLSMAYTRLKTRAQIQVIDFGEFYKIISDVHKNWEFYNAPKMTNTQLAWQEELMLLNKQHQERLANAPKFGSKEIKDYWMAHIRADLKKAGVKSNSTLTKIVDRLNVSRNG